MDKKLRALYDCRNHWQWLWITGSRHKESYKPAIGWMMRCACCQYDDVYGYDFCSCCPLVGYAWGDEGCCGSRCSLYDDWLYDSSSIDKRSLIASRMVYACNLAIEDILTGATNV